MCDRYKCTLCRIAAILSLDIGGMDRGELDSKCPHGEISCPRPSTLHTAPTALPTGNPCAASWPHDERPRNDLKNRKRALFLCCLYLKYRSLGTPPRLTFKARLLHNQEGANVEMGGFRKISSRAFFRRTGRCSHPLGCGAIEPGKSV